MRIVVALAMVLALSVPGFSARHKKRHTTGHKHVAVASKKAAPSHSKTKAHKTAGSAKTAKSKRLAAKGRSRLAGQTWRTGQMTPTPDRYREIQQALVDKGYTTQSPDGVWGAGWVDSLKRFQQDRKLEPSGKLTALTIKTLGLGTRRDKPAPGVSAANPSSTSVETIPREQP